MRPELEEEQSGAAAELHRVREQMEEVDSWGLLQDAESDTLERLAAIRSAIAGEVKEQHQISRRCAAALARLFERFIVHAEGSEGWIEPVVRNEAWTSVAVELDSGELLPVPVLHPTALDMTGRTINESACRRSTARRRSPG